MNIDNDIVFNIVQDWKKREISGAQKSVFIQKILDKRNISQRALAKELGVSYSTLHDWVSNRQMKKYYEQKNNEIDVLLDRLTFLLSKPFKPTDKTFTRIKMLHAEIEKVIGVTVV